MERLGSLWIQQRQLSRPRVKLEEIPVIGKSKGKLVESLFPIKRKQKRKRKDGKRDKELSTLETSISELKTGSLRTTSFNSAKLTPSN